MELQAGHDPTAPLPCTLNQSSEYMRRKSTEEWVGWVAAPLIGPLVYGPLPLGLAVFMALDEWKKQDKDIDQDKIAIVSQPAYISPPPTARPYDGCCYVWIEDIGTREVVAGIRVPGAGK